MALAYVRPITITKSDAGNLTNYVEMVVLNTSTLIATSKMLASGNDIRFKDTLGNDLWHWVMSSTINTATTRIFVKVPTVTGSADTVINMYYGDNSLANVESGYQVFQAGFFDGFDTAALHGALNADRWPTQVGTWTEETGQSGRAAQTTHTSTYTRSILNNVALPKPVRIIGQQSGTSGGNDTMDWRWYVDASNYYEFMAYRLGSNNRIYKTVAGVQTQLATADGGANYTRTIMALLADSSLTFYYDLLAGTSNITSNDNALSGNGYLMFWINHNYNGTLTYQLDLAAAAPYSTTVSNVVGAEVSCGPIYGYMNPYTSEADTTKHIEVHGANLATVATMQLKKGATTVNGSGIQNISATEVHGDFDFTAAPEGVYDIYMANP